jgi:DNA repair ATPase RecN
MAGKTGTERIPSADIGSAVKAKVEKLKEAQVQIEQRTKELEAERRKLDADRRELGKMEEALETM